MKRLDPKAVWLFFLGYAVVWSFAGVFWGSLLTYLLTLLFWETRDTSWATIFSTWLSITVPIVIILLIFSYLWARLTYRFYRYDLTEDGFRKELGVIYKKYVTIPYERIQNVDIYRGILARLLGLSDLHIQTAGMSFGAPWGGLFSEGRLPGLSREEAEKVRDELIRRARQSKNQGL